MTGTGEKIRAFMTGEETPGAVLAVLLALLAAVYGGAVRLRNLFYDHGILPVKSLPCGVISIGNLTVGGTGKTPMTLFLARHLQEMGFQPAVISRGYKGSAEKNGMVVSDGLTILAGPEAAGDEPFMMAQNLSGIPVLVGADRYAAGMEAVQKFSPDVIVLDDGFQHRRLHRDLDIVLVDHNAFFGNGSLLPRGILREPVAGISRADLFVITRCPEVRAGCGDALKQMVGKTPVFCASHAPYMAGIYNGEAGAAKNGWLPEPSENLDFLTDKKVFVFSGISGNAAFVATVAAFAGQVTGSMGFTDHHHYTASDFQQIIGRAQASGAAYLVTTEKDFVKIAGKMKSPLDIVVIGIRMAFDRDSDRVASVIREKVSQMIMLRKR